MNSRFSLTTAVVVVVLLQLHLVVIPFQAIPLPLALPPPNAANSSRAINTQSRSVSVQRSSVEHSDTLLGNKDVNETVQQGGPRNNNVEVGKCWPPDERIYSDNTVVENGGPSTLNGTLEVC